MGNMGIQTAIVGIVGLIIAAIASFTVLPMMIGFTDGLSLRFKPSCDMNSERFTKVFLPASAAYDPGSAASIYDTEKDILFGPGVAVSRTASAVTCSYGAITAAVVGNEDAEKAFPLYSERGSQVATVTLGEGGIAAAAAVSGSRWIAPAKVFNQLGGVGSLILDVLPIMIMVGFLSSGIITLLNHSQGINVSDHIKYLIFKLLGTIALLVSLPFAFDQLATASYTLNSGAYSVQDRFGSLGGLVLAAIPVLILAALLSWQGFDIAATVHTVRKSGVIDKAKGAMGQFKGA